ncbi:acyltransferase [Frigoribacterium sp. ACAM 257]|uniref:acyltransferase family protein n=1 Tax=Frigoribacterium sp. ACAM 257 TaxID=2508998 RepID=UPI001749C2F3|nr:acyltransferase [Frigoribacterium sp. ACAM 257]
MTAPARDASARSSAPRRARAGTLGAVLDPRRNAYNLIRLVMAAFVVVWHSFPLTGHDIGLEPVRQLASRLPVDVFFAISGYLIAMSWSRTPSVVAFLRARVLRIFPAFWVCLVLTAGVFAPVALLLRGVPAPDGFVGDAVSYVVRNAALRVWQFDIAGTPLGTPLEGAWNGSLWTLGWEFTCYLGVLVLGVLGLLRSRWALPVAYVACTAGVLASSYGDVHNWYLTNGSRFGIVFVAGAIIWRWRDSLPVRGWLLAVAALVVAVSSTLPDYGVVAALPLAYLALAAGALLKQPALSIRTDISYGTYIYGFPLQQLLATAGLASLGVPLFALLSLAITFAAAAASWHLVEKPTMKFKRRRPVPGPTDPVSTVA